MTHSDMALDIIQHAVASCKGDDIRPMKTAYYVAYAGRNMPELSLRKISAISGEIWKQVKTIIFECEHKEITK